jgi:CRP-like cAMP-binding protein
LFLRVRSDTIHNIISTAIRALMAESHRAPASTAGAALDLAHPRSANRLLASLSSEDYEQLQPGLQHIDLPQETVLFETGGLIARVYFPLAGVVSLVVDLKTGETIEAAMIGRDGVVGGGAALDGQKSLNRAVIQVAGAASTVDIGLVSSLADRSLEFRLAIMKHQQFVLAQAQQSAACNAAHPSEARLARWLLRCRDLLESDEIPLTQEFLAEMLGVQRSTVSVVAHTLQQAGFIRYSRGHIQILNLEALREVACECYETVKRHLDRLSTETDRSSKA